MRIFMIIFLVGKFNKQNNLIKTNFNSETTISKVAMCATIDLAEFSLNSRCKLCEIKEEYKNPVCVYQITKEKKLRYILLYNKCVLERLNCQYGKTGSA